MFLVALDYLATSIVFPVSSSGGMLFTTIVGVLVLGERFNKMMTLGVVLTRSKIIPDNLFLEAAKTLAGLVTDKELSKALTKTHSNGVAKSQK